MSKAPPSFYYSLLLNSQQHLLPACLCQWHILSFIPKYQFVVSLYSITPNRHQAFGMLHWRSKFYQNQSFRDFPGGPVVKAGSPGLIPGWGTKTPHGLWPKTKNNRSNIVTNSIKTLKWYTSKKNLKSKNKVT